ncbi:MAG: energy transducer TonB [Candidatus Acidiferrum sp.]
MEEAPLTKAMLPVNRPPWKSLGASVLFQAGIVITILVLSFIFTDKIEFHSRLFNVTYVKTLSPPPKLRMPKIKGPKASLTSASPVQDDDPPEESTPAERKPLNAQMNAPVRRTLSPTSAPAPTIDKPDVSPTNIQISQSGPPKPREDVKTGVLGDMTTRETGTSGERSVIAAGFGGLGTNRSSTTRLRSGVVRPAGLQDASMVIQHPRQMRAGIGTNDNPIGALEIKSKPTPAYTSEARQKKIEGNVELAVVFKADGEVTVTRVIKGLGYGLDESAEAAARGIKFIPAKRNNEPVDFEATITVVFQLAS